MFYSLKDGLSLCLCALRSGGNASDAQLGRRMDLPIIYHDRYIRDTSGKGLIMTVQ